VGVGCSLQSAPGASRGAGKQTNMEHVGGGVGGGGGCVSEWQRGLASCNVAVWGLSLRVSAGSK
jgi:hypothetical protein